MRQSLCTIWCKSHKIQGWARFSIFQMHPRKATSITHAFPSGTAILSTRRLHETYRSILEGVPSRAYLHYHPSTSNSEHIHMPANLVSEPAATIKFAGGAESQYVHHWDNGIVELNRCRVTKKPNSMATPTAIICGLWSFKLMYCSWPSRA